MVGVTGQRGRIRTPARSPSCKDLRCTPITGTVSSGSSLKAHSDEVRLTRAAAADSWSPENYKVF